MKKLLLIFTAAFAACAPASLVSAREYVPTVREDRVWEYYGRSDYEPVQALHSLRVDGTATVNGKEYSRFVLFRTRTFDINGTGTPDLIKEEARDETMYWLREEDRVLVLTYGDMTVTDPEEVTDPSLAGEFRVYDWSSRQGDVWRYPLLAGWFSEDNLCDFTVNSLPPAEVDGEECPVMYLSGEMAFHGDEVRFIMGIGVTRDGSVGAVNIAEMPGMTDSSRFPGRGSRLNRVFDASGEVIYQDDSAFIPSGIGSVIDDAAPAGDGRTYDVMGREVRETQPGGVYIRDGKKFIGR